MVISVDLDFILEPCIQLYNDLVINDVSDQNIMWEDIMRQRDLERHLSVNQENWQFICDIIKRSKNKCNIYVGNDHSSILTAINQEVKRNGISLPLDIVNIDHHHDILYKEINRAIIDKYQDPNCADWVYFLGRMGLLDNYFWIANPNSEPYDTQKMGTFKVNNFIQMNKSQFDYNSLGNIDLIFFTSSTPWIPRKFLNYHFAMIKLILETFDESKVFFLSRSFSEERNLNTLYSDIMHRAI